MPEWWQHVKFVESHPYDVWNFIDVRGEIVGACYVSRSDEIGIFIFKSHQGHGYGPEAVRLLMWFTGKRNYKAQHQPAQRTICQSCSPGSAFRASNTPTSFAHASTVACRDSYRSTDRDS
jgi:hypothetical protein